MKHCHVNNWEAIFELDTHKYKKAEMASEKSLSFYFIDNKKL